MTRRKLNNWIRDNPPPPGWQPAVGDTVFVMSLWPKSDPLNNFRTAEVLAVVGKFVRLQKRYGYNCQVARSIRELTEIRPMPPESRNG